MQYIKGLEQYQNQNPTVVTIGKFDGLHLGHECLLQRVLEHGKQDQVDTVVLTFDMTPLYQMQHKKQQVLMTSDERIRRLDGRVDYLVECPLDEKIAKMSPEDFVKDILVERFHAAYLVVGTDFTFGRDKKGDYQLLRELGSVYGYQVDVMEKKCYEGREISSTYIKEALGKGDYDLAETLLGYSYKFQ